MIIRKHSVREVQSRAERTLSMRHVLFLIEWNTQQHDIVLRRVCLGMMESRPRFGIHSLPATDSYKPNSDYNDGEDWNNMDATPEAGARQSELSLLYNLGKTFSAVLDFSELLAHIVDAAVTLAHASEGRLILGVGAGWQEREHHLFGYTLGDVPTRMARLEEGLEVITQLLRSEEPITYEGRFFHLRGAALLPRPERSGGPPILIGGNSSTYTLPLVARYADLWNANFLTPDSFQKHSATLDQLLRAAGRNPGDVRRTVMLGLFFARDMSELEHRIRETPGFAGQSLESFIEALKASATAIAGTPAMVLEQIHAYEQAGAEEVMLQWLDLDDMEGLRAFAASVLPHV